MNDKKNTGKKESDSFVSSFRSFRRRFRNKLENSRLAEHAHREGDSFSLWKHTDSDHVAAQPHSIPVLEFSKATDTPSLALLDIDAIDSARGTVAFKSIAPKTRGGYDTGECFHYLEGCKAGILYDCLAFPGCIAGEAAGDAWAHCVRECLLTKRIGKGPAFNEKAKDHFDCFMNCWNKTGSIF